MACRLETLHIHREDAYAVSVPFFRMAAEQLLADTDAENRLCQGAYDIVKIALAQVFHGGLCLSLSREYHFVGTAKLVGIVRYYRFYAYPP